MNWWMIALGIVCLLPVLWVLLVLAFWGIFELLSSDAVEYIIPVLILLSGIVGLYFILIGVGAVK